MNPRPGYFFPKLRVQRGHSKYDTSVRNTEVVYVSGNGLVTDGREVSVFDLKPGTKLTETTTNFCAR
jgi:hypothetical protein